MIKQNSQLGNWVNWVDVCVYTKTQTCADTSEAPHRLVGYSPNTAWGRDLCFTKAWALP